MDTHAFLWLMNGSPELEHSSSLAHIETASENGALLLCSISLWETAALARQGRLRPSLPLRDWIEQSLETPGLRMVEIDAAIATEAAALPGRFDGDGADRLIVAAARSRHALLATADDTLKRYAAAGHVRILEV